MFMFSTWYLAVRIYQYQVCYVRAQCFERCTSIMVVMQTSADNAEQNRVFRQVSRRDQTLEAGTYRSRCSVREARQRDP